MGKTLYLECGSGISGDMTVAALLDLGADQETLKKALASLPIEGFQTEVTRVNKSGLDACDFAVKLDARHENHDHDVEYLHGRTHGEDHVHGECHSHGHDSEHGERHSHGDGHAHGECHGHGEEHEYKEGHSHETGHSHGEHIHGQDGKVLESHIISGAEHSHEGHSHPAHEHRGISEILAIIEQADITPRAKETAVKIFWILADAEAKAHGVPAEQVHFHEVGAVDSIVDIVAAAVCLDDLDVDRVIVPRLCEGQGTIRCQHGVIPVPVPAVVNIASAYGLSLQITHVQGELVTPTGAAIVAAVRTDEKLPEEFIVKKVGLGAGKRAYECPGFLRAMIIEPKASSVKSDVICRLETNIDDCSGESLGYVMERLFQEGARDVHYTPVFMKKNRPAWQLNVICAKEDAEKLENLIFTETTTIGIRRMLMERRILKREEKKVKTSLGEAEVKICTLPDGSERIYPEYESTVKLAKKNHVSYREAYAIIENEAKNIAG